MPCQLSYPLYPHLLFPLSFIRRGARGEVNSPPDKEGLGEVVFDILLPFLKASDIFKIY